MDKKYWENTIFADSKKPGNARVASLYNGDNFTYEELGNILIELNSRISKLEKLGPTNNLIADLLKGISDNIAPYINDVKVGQNGNFLSDRQTGLGLQKLNIFVSKALSNYDTDKIAAFIKDKRNNLELGMKDRLEQEDPAFKFIKEQVEIRLGDKPIEELDKQFLNNNRELIHYSMLINRRYSEVEKSAGNKANRIKDVLIDRLNFEKDNILAAALDINVVSR